MQKSAWNSAEECVEQCRRVQKSVWNSAEECRRVRGNVQSNVLTSSLFVLIVCQDEMSSVHSENSC